VKRQKIPTKVLVRAKAAAAAVTSGSSSGSSGEQSPKKPAPPPHQPRKTLAREKVIAALKKLHPMD
jgi:hypothetical protein